MTKLQKFLQCTPLIATVLASAGLYSYTHDVTRASEQAAPIYGAAPQLDWSVWSDWSGPQTPRIVVSDNRTLEEMNERLSTILDQASSVVSDKVRVAASDHDSATDAKKAKEIGYAFADIYDTARNSQHKASDMWLLKIARDIKAPADMDRLVEIVNNQKIQMRHMSQTLHKLQEAYEQHDTAAIEKYSDLYSNMSKGVHKQLYTDLHEELQAANIAYKG